MKSLPAPMDELHVNRAVVCQRIGATKTEASMRPLPMDVGIGAALEVWRSACPFNQAQDFIFGSPERDGRQPYWPGIAMQRHVRPAAQHAGITKRIGWHTFRHSFATLLLANDAAVRVTQDLMRHSTSTLTLDTYAQALGADKRAAQSKIVKLFPSVPTLQKAAMVN